MAKLKSHKKPPPKKIHKSKFMKFEGLLLVFLSIIGTIVGFITYPYFYEFGYREGVPFLVSNEPGDGTSHVVGTLFRETLLAGARHGFLGQAAHLLTLITDSSGKPSPLDDPHLLPIRVEQIHPSIDPSGPGITTHIIAPKISTKKKLPAVVYFHGGGWAFGSPKTYDKPLRQLAARLGVVVIAADYRKSPKHPYPAALEDCIRVTEWVFENADDLNVDVSKIVLAGDSAGGNLAHSVAYYFSAIAVKPHRHIAMQVLIYPVVKFFSAMETDSQREFRRTGLFVNHELGKYMHHSYTDVYAPDLETKLANYSISPLTAIKDFSMMPKTLITTAEWDVLRDEGEMLAERMKSDGVDVEYIKMMNRSHGHIFNKNMDWDEKHLAELKKALSHLASV